MVTHHFAEFQTNPIGETRFACDCGQFGRWCSFGLREAVADHLKHKIHQRKIGNTTQPKR